MSMSNHPRGTSYIINYSAMFCNGLSDIAGKKAAAEGLHSLRLSRPADGARHESGGKKGLFTATRQEEPNNHIFNVFSF